LARAAGTQALDGLVPDADGVLRVPFQRIMAATPLLVLHRLLRGKGFHPDRLDDILQAIRQQRTGARFPGQGAKVFVDRAELVIRPEQEGVRSWRFSSWQELPPEAPLRVVPSTWDDVDPAAGPATAWFDADRITFPVELRPWRAGDRMRPDGLGGSKLVSDILIDAKVPRDRKDRIYVLADAERIIWLCGLRMAEGVKATSDSAKVVRMDRSGT
ncbi:MAG: tRNA lysidine(34) synthetase TilS, partial [Flavobacteriales bacterium]|nr:tRNA lysidine(34) synthetase TilS [Flavobacteriales bacterium]